MNNNYKKISDSIIKNTIDGIDEYMVLWAVGLGESLSMLIFILPILLLLQYLHAPMLFQWICTYVLLVICFIFWSLVGWVQSKFTGIVMAILNMSLLVLIIMQD
ncbi:hypothetical protein IV73_GL000091 [Weissella kandleri]|uniref:Uncharacterized protein n=1 Tax=Weissella kandleri TaxID=1616 RepID=A0A0R2JIC2_9LACO|nr:hypothetical protein IV73_GL000091 [Weissella kandleri]